MLSLVHAVLLVAAAAGAAAQCVPTMTIASGTNAPAEICAGALIFSDEFDYLDLYKWQHELTLSGGGNNEFQWYTNNRTNTYVEDGALHFKATLTTDNSGGQDFLYYGTINLEGPVPQECTDRSNNGCMRSATYPDILQPTQSASLTTKNSFSFRYGRLEIRAKMPAGDWLWPALWLMPRRNAYGSWPVSGEIDMAESRGNRRLMAGTTNAGVEQVSSTLHWGPYFRLDGFDGTHWERQDAAGYHNSFKTYQLEWTDEHLKFSVDDDLIGYLEPPAGGFYELGNFASLANGFDNPWKNGGRMAPFDQEFYIIMNLAVGGSGGFFWDGFVNDPPKPWVDSSPQPFLDFWNARDAWLATWSEGDATFQVDYVHVYAI